MADDDRRSARIATARLVTDRDGHTVIEGDLASVAEATEAIARARARDERRAEVWGAPGPEAMTRLARGFPSLRNAEGIDPWDSVTLLSWACGGRDHGEVLAAKFVLSVWNTTTDWEEVARDEGILTASEARFSRFDLFEAMAVWDDAHIEAMQAWVWLPFFP